MGEDVVKRARVREATARYDEGYAAPTSIRATAPRQLVGEDPAFVGAIGALMRAARTNAAVLITGESGTGKELAARVVHDGSTYRNGPLVAVNAAGLAPSLIASELFGHEKGAFTDAKEQKIGKIETAQHGTLFLDEIGDLPLDMQGYLLRFLEERTIVRVGGTESIIINARIVAATNANLRQRIAEGRFRQDLFYRLNILSVELPPLRARGNDVRLLAQYFLDQAKVECGRPRLAFQKCALAKISTYHWPGNVRELAAVIRRAVIMSETDVISSEALRLPDDACGNNLLNLDSVRARAERTAITAALQLTNRNISRASRELGVSRVTLYRLMEKHALGPSASMDARQHADGGLEPEAGDALRDRYRHHSGRG